MTQGGAGLLWGGVLLGLSIAAPIGPVNIEMIRRGLERGFTAAFLVGVGSTIADVVYILAAYAGADPLSHEAWARGLVFGAGALVLTYLGVAAIRGALARSAPEPGSSAPRAAVAGRGAFTAGFVITILNPMTIAFWLSILAAALAARPRQGFGMELLYVGSLMAGCLLWVVTLATALHYGRRVVRGPVLKLVSVTAGIVLIGFGIHFALRAGGII